MQNLSVEYRAYREYLDRVHAESDHIALMKSLLADANASEGFERNMCRYEWSEDWIAEMLEALPYVEQALAEQRKFIVPHEEIRRIDQAKKTSVESVRHLAQHSNMISNVSGDEIIPDRVLIVERDDNYLIYENRFLYTLILRMRAFLDERLKAVAEQNESQVYSVYTQRSAAWSRKRLDCSLRLNLSQRPEKMDVNKDVGKMSASERVRYLHTRIENLMSAPLMRLLKGATIVSSPIVRTNVFKKNVNFKRSLELFEFLESYNKPGFQIISDEPSTNGLDAEFRNDLCELIAFEYLVLRMNAQPELRSALEQNYARENELAEQERIRQEEERERQVQLRIQKAREEEIAIREREIAMRDEQIKNLGIHLEQKNAQLLQAFEDLKALKAEHELELAKLKQDHFNELNALKQEQSEAMNVIRHEHEVAMQRCQSEKQELRQSLMAEVQEAKNNCEERLKSQREKLRREYERSAETTKQRYEQQLERQNKSWQKRFDAQKKALERNAEKSLRQQHNQDAEIIRYLKKELARSEAEKKALECAADGKTNLSVRLLSGLKKHK